MAEMVYSTLETYQSGTSLETHHSVHLWLIKKLEKGKFMKIFLRLTSPVWTLLLAALGWAFFIITVPVGFVGWAITGNCKLFTNCFNVSFYPFASLAYKADMFRE